MERKIKLGLLTVATLALVGTVYASADTVRNKADTANGNPSASINKDVIEGSWKQLEGKIKQKWADLTDDEILKMQGTATEREGILQKKYGYTKEKAKESIQEFLKENEASSTK